ncbi:MAG: hypothetical protein JXB49_17825 [Bacteroidales bacterium]|nr:hypothetical protein [Bacteroidales bacterium]
MEKKKCQFCLSDIPKDARKCLHCLEWQEEQHAILPSPVMQNSYLNFLIRFPNAKKAFQLSLVEKIPFHYGVSILIIGVICFVLMQLSWYNYNEDGIYLVSFLLFTLQMIISWAGLIWVYRMISKNYIYFIKLSSLDQASSEQNFIKHHDRIFHKWYSLLFGILVGLIAAAGDYIVGTPFKTEEAKLIFAGFEFLNMFFAGAAIYSMLMFALFIHQISSYTVDKAISLDKNNTINNIGSIHLRTSILAIVPLFFGVIAKLFGSWSWDTLIIIWYVSFSIAIIIYIYWPMMNIHRLMKGDLESQLRLIQNKIQKTLIEINHNPSSINFSRLNEYRALEKSISGENTWPFDTKSLAAAFFAIIFPIILIIIDKFWNA